MITEASNNGMLRRRSHRGLIIIAILLIVVALLFLAFYLPKPQGQKALVTSLDPTGEVRQQAEKLNRPSVGNKDAKIVIVAFSDFQCPVCQAEFPVIREITNKYKDQILYIYRQYPVISEDSVIIANASLCANEQNKFWAFHDKLFLYSGDFTNEILASLAKQSGLDSKKFDDCLKNQQYKEVVAEDFQDGLALGVSGTPTFFINGNKLSGNIPKNAWEQVINELLK